jgi:hypothetical protein
MAAQHKAKRIAKKPEPQGESPVLRLKVRGPGIRSGRIAVPDLIKICQDAQSAVTRQAEALEGRKTLHPGPTTELIRHECTLELFAIRKGSTTLEFGLAKAQMPLPFNDVKTFGAEVVEELADTIKSLGNGNKKEDLDPGVLQSIYELGSIVGAGRISELTWIAPKGGRRQVRGLINKKVRERAATRLSGPTFKVVQIDGVLDMADFSRRDRKCRIDPAIGASVTCTFGPDHETAIQALLRQPVRVVGIGKILPHSDRVESLDIQKIEPLPSLALGEGNFVMSPTIEQLAVAQGVKPLNDIGKLGGFLADDEVDEFVSEIYGSRGRE